MKPETLYLLFIIILFTIHSPSHSNNTPVKNELTASELKPYGRSFLNAENNLELISSAVHFGFSFTGQSCTIDAFINDANGHNYLQYELDGVYQKRIKVEGNKIQSIIINAGMAL